MKALSIVFTGLEPTRLFSGTMGMYEFSMRDTPPPLTSIVLLIWNYCR